MARNPDRVAKAESAEFSRNAQEQLSLEDLGFSPEGGLFQPQKPWLAKVMYLLDRR
jgi:hypothetical protein